MGKEAVEKAGGESRRGAGARAASCGELSPSAARLGWHGP